MNSQSYQLSTEAPLPITGATTNRRFENVAARLEAGASAVAAFAITLFDTERFYSGIFTLLLAAITVFAPGGSARATAQDRLTVTVPFAFTANHQYLPAGSYNVDWLTDRSMELRNAKTGEVHVLTVRPEQGQIIETRGRLVFLQDGSRYYLARVWMAGSSVHSDMAVQHRPERSPKGECDPESSGCLKPASVIQFPTDPTVLGVGAFANSVADTKTEGTLGQSSIMPRVCILSRSRDPHSAPSLAILQLR